MTNILKKLLAVVPVVGIVLTVGIAISGCGGSTTVDGDLGTGDASVSDLSHKG